MTAPSDFPAAHSMDTEWFAVDAEGNIGRFDTGEDGAFPFDAATGFGASDPSFDISRLNVARLAHMVAGGNDPLENDEPNQFGGQLIVVVDPPSDAYRGDPASLASVADLLDAGEMEIIRREAPIVLLATAPLSAERAAELSEREGVRWTYPAESLYELFYDAGPDDGLFHFSRDHGDDPGRYERYVAPHRPINIDDVTADIAEPLKAISLPVNFAADDGEVHLADHLDPSEAASWGDLPLRYDEGYFERQEEELARRREAAEAARKRLPWVLLMVFLLLAFVFVAVRR